ncbi:hypothetical protein ECC02_005155 [Trypanosoma cruzi]|uniref:Uncharacterized protein n=1 Tax=Trypanosoma cruzi TaxID=5693 RepID=A0A7J6Y542_TRYCR|nr:hypothetical protein ECC02_005155 [Trypanosoma cruzi]
MTAHTVLRALVRRAAAYERPFNSQDSLLIVRALQALRYRSDDVRGVCEKCAFAIASSRITVPVERAIEALSGLLSLQAGALPVVHEKLAERLTEVTPQTASPRYVQKAAVVIMKLGRRYCKPAIADHVFDVLTQLLPSHPNDVALRLAVISVFMYTSSAVKYEAMCCKGTARNEDLKEEKDRRVLTLLEAATHIVDAHVLSALRGNSTLQAFHIFPVLPWRSLIHDTSKRNGQACIDGMNSPADHDYDRMLTKWERVENAFFEELQFSTVVPGGYAQFMFDFLPTLGRNDTSGVVFNLALLDVVCHENFRKALNSYDVAKIAMSVSRALLNRRFSAGPRTGRTLTGVERAKDEEEGGNENDREKLEERTLLRVVGSLVQQLCFFDAVAGWSRPDGGRVDQVAVGAVWRVTQKFVCNLQPGAGEVQQTVAQLVRLTKGIALKLPDVWSWVLYSMSLCARTTVYNDGLRDGMEILVQESSLARRPEELPLRSCVQALYAVSILMVPSTEEKELMLRATQASMRVQERVQARRAQWTPEHPLVVSMLQRLLNFRFREYSGDDIPMLLQSLSNLLEVTTAQHAQPLPAVQQMMERVFYYMQGNRNLDWYRMHGVSTTYTLLSMAEFLPVDCKQLRDAVKQFLFYLQSEEMIELSVLRRWLEPLTLQKRRGVNTTWLCEEILKLLAMQVHSACTGRKEPFHFLLNALECAHEIGASIAFVNSSEEVSITRRVTIHLDLEPFLHDGMLKAVDAAQVLRIMSYEVQSAGLVRVHGDHIVQLRRIAIGDEPAAGKRVETLLHLLRANATLQASKALFDTRTLEQIMVSLCHQLTENRKALIQRGDAGKIVYALLSSQVLLRLGCSLRSYKGLADAVGEVLDSLEATGEERPETLFQLRLLCGL